MERGNQSFINGPGHMTIIAVTPIYGKKHLLLRNRQTDFHENWGLLSIKGCINDDPGVRLTYFTARSILVTKAFLWEKVITVDFSEIIAACALKIGRCSQLTEFMEVCGY